MTEQNQPYQEELEQLVDDLLDGGLDDAQHARLASLLASQPHAARQFAEMMALHAMLETELDPILPDPLPDPLLPGRLPSDLNKDKASPAAEQPSVFPARSVLSAVKYFSQPIPLSLLVAATFLGMLLFVMAYIVPEKPKHPHGGDVTGMPANTETSDRPLAYLNRTQDLVWAKTATQVERGAELDLGDEIRIESGLAELIYGDGAKVILEGPCRFVISGPRQGTLDTGKLTAQVLQRGRGFSVLTPTVRVIDLGTEFGVEIQPSGRVDAGVYRGEVELRLLGDHQVEPVKLTSGMTGSVSADGERIEVTEGTNENLIRHMPGVPVAPPRTATGYTWTGGGGSDSYLDPGNWKLPDGKAPATFPGDNQTVGRDVVISSANVTMPISIQVQLGDGQVWQISDSKLKGGMDTNFHPISLGGGGKATIHLRGKSQVTYGWAWDIEWQLHDQSQLTSTNANPADSGVLGKTSFVDFHGPQTRYTAAVLPPGKAYPALAQKFRVAGALAEFGSDPAVIEPGDNIVLAATPDGEGTTFRPLFTNPAD